MTNTIKYNDKNVENNITENKLERYLSYTNNNVESISYYIKNLIPFGKKVTQIVFNKYLITEEQ